MERRVHLAEIAVSVLTIAIAALFLWDARRYSASPFEPIGSGAVPAGVAAAALVLSAIMLTQAVRGLLAPRLAAAPQELTLRVAATFLLTVGYTALLATGRVRYAFATVAFVALGVLVIAEQPRRLAPWAVGIALVLGLGLDFVFRTIFVTNIP
jgi:hypothetical protein